jgi:hypothetical protein
MGNMLCRNGTMLYKVGNEPNALYTFECTKNILDNFTNMKRFIKLRIYIKDGLKSHGVQQLKYFLLKTYFKMKLCG